MSGDDAIDRSPARLSSLLSVAGGAVAAVAVAVPGIPLAAIAAIAGMPLLVLGLARGSRRAVSLGAFAVFAGVLVAGVVGAPAEWLLLGATGAVFAWDFGEQAINVGEQLGREARTRRIEVFHAASATAVGVVTTGIAYLIFRLATGGQPLAALVLLLLSAIVLAESLRD